MCLIYFKTWIQQKRLQIMFFAVQPRGKRNLKKHTHILQEKLQFQFFHGLIFYAEVPKPLLRSIYQLMCPNRWTQFWETFSLNLPLSFVCKPHFAVYNFKFHEPCRRLLSKITSPSSTSQRCKQFCGCTPHADRVIYLETQNLQPFHPCLCCWFHHHQF